MGEKKAKQPGKIQHLWGYLKQYWRKAPAGRYLSLKEVAAYCVGGMGAVGATVIPTYVSLSAGIYIAAALNIKVDDIVLIGIISSVLTILRSPLMGYMIDNTNTKYGKFRPYLMWTPIPILLCFMGFGFLDMIPNYVAMLVVYTILFNVMQFFFGLYGTAFNTLVQVITPKQSEKEWLMGVGSFAYSLGPSIVNAGLPLIANLLFTTKGADGQVLGIHLIAPYRWLVPLLLLICFAVGYLVAFGTKERIVQSTEHKNKVGFWRGVKTTSKNKYFWINNISNVIGVFRLVGTTFTMWLCSYAIGETWAQSLFVTILGTAYTPGMLLAPLFIKKFGKKNLTIYSNLICVLLTVPMILVCIKPAGFTPYLIIALSYLILLVSSIQVVTGPALLTQIYDYQQYKTGDRLEGFISQYGAIIGTLCGMATAYIQPAIYKAFGYTQDPSVLNDPKVLYGIIGACCLLGVLSGILSIIPYLFWDMSEKRHACVIEILKVRALGEDGTIPAQDIPNIEQELERGEVKALENYLIANNIATDSDFISIEDSPQDHSAEPEDSSESSTEDQQRVESSEDRADIEQDSPCDKD